MTDAEWKVERCIDEHNSRYRVGAVSYLSIWDGIRGEMMKLRIKHKLAAWLIRTGHKLRYTKEIYTEHDGVWEGDIMCARCRYCGNSTQTTNRICWKCK